jgi:hypothetical protein
MDARRLAAFFALATLASVGSAGATAATAAKPFVPVVHTPRTHEHSEFVVETNKLGQVTRATKVTRSNDRRFNAMTYGNTLQAYIRTPDGKAIPGVYRLTYDYNPANQKITRGVALVRMGGVNPNAPGAVIVEERKLEAEQQEKQAAAAEASALPGLHQMTRHHH